MKFSIWAFTLAFLASTVHLDNTLQKDIEMVVSNINAGKHNFPVFESYIGNGKESSTSSLYFEYNFGRRSSIVGDKKAASWGIDCTDTDQQYNNSCKVMDQTESQDFYYSSSFNFKKANLFLRFNSGAKLDTTDKSAMPVQLVTGGKNWPLKTAGVIGLAPQGDFAKYVRQMFADSTTFLFGYENSNPKAENDDLMFNNHVVLNPVYTDADVALKLAVGANTNNWNFVGDVVVTNTEWKFDKTNICFSSISNELLIVADNIVMCDGVKKVICDGKTGPACTKDVAAMDKAPAITVTIQGVTLSFNGDDYLYFGKDNVVSCRFGDLSNLRGEQVCAEDTEVAVGRLFFSHYMPALTFNKDNTSAVTLIKSYNFVEPSSKIWIIVGIICAIIAVGVILFILLKRRSNGGDEHYRDL